MCHDGKTKPLRLIPPSSLMIAGPSGVKKLCIDLDYLTIRPVAPKGYGSIAHEASWAIHPWSLRANGLIVLLSPN